MHMVPYITQFSLVDKVASVYKVYPVEEAAVELKWLSAVCFFWMEILMSMVAPETLVVVVAVEAQYWYEQVKYLRKIAQVFRLYKRKSAFRREANLYSCFIWETALAKLGWTIKPRENHYNTYNRHVYSYTCINKI